jgi:hypothetical protein
VSSASMRRSVAPGKFGIRLAGIGDWKEYLSGGAATSESECGARDVAACGFVLYR